MLAEVVLVCNVQKKRVYLCLYRSNNAYSATESETVDSPASSSQTVGECSTPVSTPATSRMTPTVDDDSDHTAPYHPDVKDIETQPLKGRTLSFRQSWFDNYPWLHYKASVAGVVCFYCSKAERLGLFDLSKNRENTFISTGFRNWKKRSPALSGACPLS